MKKIFLFALVAWWVGMIWAAAHARAEDVVFETYGSNASADIKPKDDEYARGLATPPWTTNFQSWVVQSMDPSFCRMAIVSPEGEVTIDWPCTEKYAAEHKDNPYDQAQAIAALMLAIRDKTAKDSK